MFACDGRSPKAAEIRGNHWVEACLYLPDTQEQFRLHGTATLHGPETPDALLKEVRSCWALDSNSRVFMLWGMHRTQDVF